ncbi:MAG: ABC transporter substrate-binding protein [Planctomycetota bacterium]
MPTDTPHLRGITWNHTRGFVPMVHAAQRLSELHPNVQISWEKRSLQDFADAPLDRLAEAYDLLVIDHPWAGFAASKGVLVAMEELLSEEFLADQAEHTVGPSHESYRFGGRQWALALDAATPVASWRPDLISDLPKTFDDLLALADDGKVIMPGIPQDTLMNFYMFICVGADSGANIAADPEVLVEREVGKVALEHLRRLAAKLPREHFDWNPIAVYEQMTRTDNHAYCPWAYGYSNYARPGYAAHRLAFGDIVTLGDQPMRTTLGGTGLAVSSKTPHRDIAQAYAKLIADPTWQATQFVEAGGQPGHRAAWLDERANDLTGGYFRDTLPCLDRAYLRPRYDGSLSFQGRDGGGAIIRDYLMHGGDADAVLDDLDALYRKSRGSA